MVEVDIIEEVKNNFVSEIGEKFTVEVVLEVWKNISKLIINYLQHNKCMILKNIGIFSLGKWSLETGIRRELVHFQPVFKLSVDLLENYGLHQPKQYTDDKVPVAPINYCHLANESKVDKECVLYALQMITETLWKHLYRNEDIILDFPELGTLLIKKQVVKFNFSKTIEPARLESPRICPKIKVAEFEYYPQEIVPCKFHTKSYFQNIE
ncbi:hypothetical protein O3M35_010518 [Rhynocoris fuscipes]|uniref:CCDC81 HU domain-containing protein n=1 Tax=Rhynocoris fuscipes TaxID=488301 RepID=A0AAW1D062_9HEMI